MFSAFYCTLTAYSLAVMQEAYLGFFKIYISDYYIVNSRHSVLLNFSLFCSITNLQLMTDTSYISGDCSLSLIPCMVFLL
jgi:hypothetical protein